MCRKISPILILSHYQAFLHKQPSAIEKSLVVTPSLLTPPDTTSSIGQPFSRRSSTSNAWLQGFSAAPCSNTFLHAAFSEEASGTSSEDQDILNIVSAVLDRGRIRHGYLHSDLNFHPYRDLSSVPGFLPTLMFLFLDSMEFLTSNHALCSKQLSRLARYVLNSLYFNTAH